MSDVLINWFVTNLGGKVGKELILFIISMVPILELRGGLLAAGPAFLNIPMWRAIPVGIIGNLLPIPFILLLITKIFDWMKGTKRLKPVVEKLEKKAMSQSANIEKYEFWGLVAFVGIPLPGTGAWTRGIDRSPAWNPFQKGVSGDRDRCMPCSMYHDDHFLWNRWGDIWLN